MTSWTDYQDDISDAISDSMDVDWSASVGARAVVAWLNEHKPLSAGGADAGQRDLFAVAALTGLCAMHDATGMWSWTPDSAAQTAYQIADAMLAAQRGEQDGITKENPND